MTPERVRQIEDLYHFQLHTGIHGWFWQNKGGNVVQFHLNVAGFFDSAKMYVDG